MHYCRFAHDSSGLEADLRELLEERLYRFFLSGDAVGTEPHAPRVADRGTGRAVTDVLDRLCRTASVEGYTRGNAPLAERAAHDAVAWCANRLAQAQSNENLRALDELGAWGRDTHEQALSRLARATALFGATEELSFLTRRLQELQSTAPVGEVPPLGAAVPARVEVALRRQAVRTATTAAHREIDRLVAERRRELLTSAFVESFPAFVAELNDLLPRLAAVQERLKDFFGNPGKLWDRELREWEAVPWEDLERLAGELESEDSLKRLAHLLGRMGRTAPAPAPAESSAESVVTRETVAVGRSEVDGVTTGTDLGSLTAGELALLADETTRPLFDKRFADADLVIRSYKTREEREHRSIELESPPDSRSEDEGPIVMCVDTSGSMAGEPERVAKLTTLALARAAVSMGRRCFLIFYSTQIHCIEVTDVGASIHRLVDYLHGSVRGGTDPAPALRKAVEVLRSSSYANADVLVVSDFRIPKVPAAIRSLIDREQTERGTRFHSLTITDKPVHDPFFLFDYRWLYDISNPISRGISPDAFRLLH